MKEFLEKTFKLNNNKTNIKTEVLAGLTIFFAICYVTVVIPNQLTGFKGLTPQLWNACFVGGILSAVISTLVMAFVANKPLAVASGLGLNSFFFVSFVSQGLLSLNPVGSYQEGLAVVLLSGILFLVFNLTNITTYIFNNIPDCIKNSIPFGIGLFIAFLGLQNGGLVIKDENTFVSFPVIAKMSFVEIIPVILSFIGFILIIVFTKSKQKYLNRFAILFSILITTISYYLLNFISKNTFDFTMLSLSEVFSDWYNIGFLGAFKGFKTLFQFSNFGDVLNLILLVFTFTLISTFDTLGAILGTSTEPGMLDQFGNPKNTKEAFVSSSIGTISSSLVGTSSVTPIMESHAGILAGGRTGLTSLVTGLLFALCFFVAPIATLIPSCATAPVLIYIGVLICKSVSKIDFNNLIEASVSFLTFIMMIATNSISNGILIGSITYVLLMILTGKYSKKDLIISIIAVFGILRYAFVAL